MPLRFKLTQTAGRENSRPYSWSEEQKSEDTCLFNLGSSPVPKCTKRVYAFFLFRTMKNLLHQINRSLTGKLVIAISIFMFVGSGLIWVTTIYAQRKGLMEDALTRITAFADLTRKSLQHDMLTGDMRGIQQTIQALGTAEPVSTVRILNASGEVEHSSSPEEIGRKIDIGLQACGGCHQKVQLSSSVIMHNRKLAIRRDKNNRRVLILVDTIRNESPCFTAACHVHHENQRNLGFLISDFSLADIDSTIQQQVIRTSFFLFLVVATIAAVLSLILWQIVLRPIHGLNVGMRRVASGDLSSKIEPVSQDELGRLGSTFNEMTDELAVARHRMEKWTQSLEEEVEKKTKEIRETQEKLIQSEKMAALGRMTADIAHEIRNPLTALGGFGRRIEKEATTAKQRQYARLIVEEADRLEHILRDVLTFSWEPRFHFEHDSLTGTISSAVMMFKDICAEQGITVEEKYGCDLPVYHEKDHVRQAILNLLSNSIDAMEQTGQLTVSTAKESENDIFYVAVHIEDTGPGIEEDKLDQVFEPFYTTKKIGQGTGLGLAICRKIITEHGGFIRLQNLEAGGLRASLFFPYQPAEAVPETIPCWEFMHCGRDKDGSVKCPAYPNFGRSCWAVAGTLCSGKVQGSYAAKLEDCRKCAFYNAMLEKTKEGKARES